MTLAPQHQKLVDDSAVAPEVAAERGYYTAFTKTELRELGFPPSQLLVPTLVVPVYNVLGELATYQHRPDRPRLNRDGKPIKYETRARSQVVVDVPRRARPRLQDRKHPLFVTEGSRKADAAVSKGLCCIALLGVWSWRYADGLLPDWDYIGVNGRRVYVVFDSDVMEKSAVYQALCRLKALLEHRGAEVRIIYLPSGDGGSKTGLDDFLAEHSVDDLLSLAVAEVRRPHFEEPDAPIRQFAPRTLDDVVIAVRRWLHLPDLALLHAVLASYVANRFSGPPVWLLIVGPSSGGKTELLMPLLPLPDVKLASTLTEGALLSGTSSRERATGAKGGLLRDIGDFGIIVMKDFTSIIAQNRDTRGEVLAALREIYDGSWARFVGVDGGRELRWDGKVGLIAGVTPAIDQQHSVMASLGERFLLFRLSNLDEDTVTAAAIAQAEDGEGRRRAIEDAVGGLLTSVQVPAAPARLDPSELSYLTKIAKLAVRGRSDVQRDTGSSKEILFVPPPESPARFAQALHRLWGAALVIGLPRGEAWALARRVALSSMPALRCAVLEVLRTRGGWSRTSPIALDLSHPRITTLRTLEDLNAHGLVERRAEGNKEAGAGTAYEWRLAAWAADALDAALPDQPIPQSPSHGEKGNVVFPSTDNAVSPPDPDFGEQLGERRSTGLTEPTATPENLAFDLPAPSGGVRKTSAEPDEWPGATGSERCQCGGCRACTGKPGKPCGQAGLTGDSAKAGLCRWCRRDGQR